MNRTDLIRAISNKNGVSTQVVEGVLDSFLEILRLSLAVGEDVTIRSFGRFERKVLIPTVRRAPKSGELVKVPGRTSVRFVPATALREYLNGRSQNGSG